MKTLKALNVLASLLAALSPKWEEARPRSNRIARGKPNGGTRTGVAAAKRSARKRRNIAKRRSA